MRRPWFVVGVFMTWVVLGSLGAQPVSQPPVDSKAQQQQQQKQQQYLRIEYERCRNDVVELWAKGDAAEQRVKDLEEELRKVTEELSAFKGVGSAAQPAN